MIIRDELSRITKAEKTTSVKYIIANYILEQITNNHYPTISNISNNCYVSKSSVVRFCKNLGYDGYKEFILKIKFQDDEHYAKDIIVHPESTKKEILELENFNTRLIEHFNKSNNNFKELINIKDSILQSRKIYLFGSAEIESFLIHFYDYLNILNLNVVFLRDKKTSSFILDYLNTEDVCIFFVTGVSNEYLKKIWDYIDVKNKCDKIIICSKSQKEKFKNANESIELSFNENIISIHDKELEFLYIFKQLFILLLSGTENKNIFYPVHKF